MDAIPSSALPIRRQKASDFLPVVYLHHNNRGRKDWRWPQPNPHRVQTMHVGDNFGVVEINWEKSPRVSLQIRDIEGDITIQQKIPLKLLQAIPNGR